MVALDDVLKTVDLEHGIARLLLKAQHDLKVYDDLAPLHTMTVVAADIFMRVGFDLAVCSGVLDIHKEALSDFVGRVDAFCEGDVAQLEPWPIIQIIDGTYTIAEGVPVVIATGGREKLAVSPVLSVAINVGILFLKMYLDLYGPVRPEAERALLVSLGAVDAP